MEYSNEFLARVYGAYIGCDIRHMSACVGFVGKYRVGVMLSVCSYTTEILVGGYGHGNKDLATIATSKLLLTPLSAITDEDAIEVAKMANPNSIMLRTIVHGQNVARAILSNNTNALPTQISGLKYQRIIDYLRSRGYDTGYAEIPSLIDAGLAIDKTTLNN